MTPAGHIIALVVVVVAAFSQTVKEKTSASQLLDKKNYHILIIFIIVFWQKLLVRSCNSRTRRTSSLSNRPTRTSRAAICPALLRFYSAFSSIETVSTSCSCSVITCKSVLRVQEESASLANEEDVVSSSAAADAQSHHEVFSKQTHHRGPELRTTTTGGDTWTGGPTVCLHVSLHRPEMALAVKNVYFHFHFHQMRQNKPFEPTDTWVLLPPCTPGITVIRQQNGDVLPSPFSLQNNKLSSFG